MHSLHIKALEDLYKKGKLKAIGVSNFYPDRISDICAFNEIVPQVNQVETNVFNQRINLIILRRDANSVY